MDPEGPRGERAERSALVGKEIEYFYWIGALILTIGIRLYLFRNYYTINNDGVLYIEVARRFWEGRWLDGLSSFYPPVFPLMIALAYPLVGDWELAGQFWPLILGVLVSFPLFALLRRIYGLRAAQIALFFYAVSPYLARFSLHVRSEMPYIFFLILALYFLQRGIDGESPLSLLFMGVSSALAYLVRSEGFGLLIVGIFFLLYRGRVRRSLQKPLFQIVSLSVGFALLALPYILYLRHDTGRWLISRKAGFIVALGLAEHNLSTEQIGMEKSDQVGVVDLISSHPLGYAKKVFIDLFRSLGVYFEALHYSFLPFLFLGWFYFFRGRFREKEDFLFLVTILFYLATFSLLYVNRRYAAPLVPLSLGWVAGGYCAMEQYLTGRFGRRGALLTGIVLVLFLIGTLPKTLQAIGKEKLYLREAGAYLKGKAGRPTVITTNARVAFYAEGQNVILVEQMKEIPALLGATERAYVALDESVWKRVKGLLLKEEGWIVDKEFSDGPGEALVVLARRAD